MPPNSSVAAPLTTLKTPMRRGVAAPPAASPPHHLLSVQRSEFEDFMNAYRPTLDHPQEPPPPHPQNRPAPSDFGRSIKRLMGRPGGGSSPNTQSKNPTRVRDGAQDALPGGGKKPGSQRVAPSDPKAPERQQKQQLAKRPAELVVPPQIDVSNRAAPPVPPPPKKSSVAQQPPPKSPTKKTSSLQPPPASPQPKAKPRPPPEAVVAIAPPAEGANKDKGRPEGVDSQHCLVVTGTGIGRFLPPHHNPDPILSLRVVPVPDRKYHVIMEFEEASPSPRPLTSASGMMVAPPFDEDEARARDARDQLSCFHWIKESHVAPMGMLLMNVERISEFPFVTYLVVGGGRQELAQKLKFVGERPLSDRHEQLRFLAGYEEPVTICRPPPSLPERPASDRTGFVICLYQVLAGEDQVRLDQNWVTWTGARQIYRTLPPCMGLRRISVHKSLLSPTRTVNYVLVCEFSHIMDHLTDACVLVDHLRARCCGFIGIYRVLDAL